MRKLIITENQLDSLKIAITEGKYAQVIPKISKGNYLQIVTNNNDILHFLVSTSVSGQLYLDNVNKGVYKNEIWFISAASLTDDDLTYNYINKVKQPHLITAPHTWPKRSLNNIKELNVLDAGGKVINRVDIEKPLGQNDLSALIEEYLGMQPNEQWKWSFDDQSYMDVQISNVEGKSIAFEIIKTSGAKASRYDSIIGRDLEFEVNDSNINLRPSDENYQYEWDIIINVFLGDAGGNKQSNGEDGDIKMVKSATKITDLADMGKQVNFTKLNSPETDKNKKDSNKLDIDEMNPDQLRDYLNRPENELLKRIMGKDRSEDKKSNRFRDWLLGKSSDNTTEKNVKELLSAYRKLKEKRKTQKDSDLWSNFRVDEKLWVGFSESLKEAGLESRYKKTYKGRVSKKVMDKDRQVINIAMAGTKFAIQLYEKMSENEYLALVIYMDSNGNKRTEKIKTIIQDRF